MSIERGCLRILFLPTLLICSVIGGCLGCGHDEHHGWRWPWHHDEHHHHDNDHHHRGTEK